MYRYVITFEWPCTASEHSWTYSCTRSGTRLLASSYVVLASLDCLYSSAAAGKYPAGVQIHGFMLGRRAMSCGRNYWTVSQYYVCMVLLVLCMY